MQQTDRQDYCSNTALCTEVHRAVKLPVARGSVYEARKSREINASSRL